MCSSWSQLTTCDFTATKPPSKATCKKPKEVANETPAGAVFICVSNSPWMLRLTGTAARTEILQQCGKDLAHNSTEHTLNVPWHRHCCYKPSYLCNANSAFFNLRQHISPGISHTTKAKPNFQQHFLFHLARKKKQWADTFYLISPNSQNSQTSNLEKTAQLVPDSQFNTKDTSTQGQTQLKATEADLTRAGMDVQCNWKLYHTIN